MPAFALEPITAPENWKTLPIHPFAEDVPFGKDIDLKEMVAGMKEHGYDPTEPVILVRDVSGHLSVGDGRHKRASAIQAGVTPTFALYVGDNLTHFVYSKKVIRQHPSPVKRALMATAKKERLAALAGPAEARDSAESRNGSANGHVPSQREVAKEAGTSQASLSRAEAVKASGIKQLQWLLSTERISLSSAAEIAKLTPAEQKKKMVAYFCERCLRTGATSEDCGSCDRARRPAPKARKPKADATGRGETKFDLTAFKVLVAKAMAETNKLARERGHVGDKGAVKPPKEMLRVKELLEKAVEAMAAWHKAKK